jgi:ERCC4-related helicase
MVDRKWNELRGILQSDEFHSGPEPRKIIIFTEHKDTLSYLVE